MLKINLKLTPKFLLMIKNFLILMVCIFSLSNSNAQKKYFSAIDHDNLRVNNENVINYDITVKKPSFYHLDLVSLIAHLNEAPKRNDTSSSNIFLEIPAHKKLETYEIFKVQTLAPQLAQDYSMIQSYVGKRIDIKDGSILRITITPQGFYAMILKPDVGQIFINPYDKSAQYYMSYKKSQAADFNPIFCEFENSKGFVGQDPLDIENDSFTVDDAILRTYDLALACTGEYAQFHINQAGLSGAPANQQVAAVLAAFTVTIDRVNQIYERDLGVSMQLIPNTDQLIFLNAETDPYTNNNGGAVLGQNQNEIDSTIGSGNYDIGHVFSTGGGGIATLASVCVNGIKARAVTGLQAPVGDPFDVDYVAHEMGHQLGANHTQNNDCQRNNPTAVEPGSASTIMGYAGVCAPNVQNNSDAHLHQVSINEIFNNISSSSGSNCGNFVGQSNTAPTITPVPNYTIPNGTAFYLDVDAVDAENDPLTYNWEQINNNVSPQPPEQTSTVGPNFRSFPSKTNSRRYFPDFNDVLNNNLAPTWEVIPTVARSMNFAVTVRDNNIQVGQSSRDITVVNFASVGPFEVTSQNTIEINWIQGETKTITWNVAGTTANGINTSNVNILLSTDGGQNFNTVLASNTPNDGIEDILVPNLQSSLCRIMVEAVDNVFYAINTNSFAIDSTCDDYGNNISVAIPDGFGTTTPIQGAPAFSSINIPDDIQNITDININLNVTHEDVSEIILQLLGNSEFTNLWIGNCSGQATIDVIFNDNGSSLPGEGDTTCGNPITGVYSPASTNTSITEIFAAGTQGTFSLAAIDYFTGNTGTINSWEIEICSTTFSVVDNSIRNFTISPNPNNGIFNLTLNQPISDNSKISIYDLQGRLIENLKFDSNSASQRIVLQNHYQSGLYIIEISNENGKSVSKLIIN